MHMSYRTHVCTCPTGHTCAHVLQDTRVHMSYRTHVCTCPTGHTCAYVLQALHVGKASGQCGSGICYCNNYNILLCKELMKYVFLPCKRLSIHTPFILVFTACTCTTWQYYIIGSLYTVIIQFKRVLFFT